MALNYVGSRNGAQRNLVPVLIGNTKTIAVGEVVETFTAGSATNGLAAVPLKGVVHAIIDKNTLPFVVGTSVAGSQNTSDTNSVTTLADNTTTLLNNVMVDTSLDSLYSAEVSGTLGTTASSDLLGCRIDIDSANTDFGRLLETTATRTVATTKNFYSHGKDPADATRLIVSLAQSEEYSAPTTES